MRMKFKSGFVFWLIGLFLVTGSCNKIANDKIPPRILLNGRNPDTMLLGCTYSEPGYMLMDDNDKSEISVYFDNGIPSDTTGSFFVKYKAVDPDSNWGYTTRRVQVIELSLNTYLGEFVAIDTFDQLYNYADTYNIQSRLINVNPPEIAISNLAGFGDDFEVTFPFNDSKNFQISQSQSDTVVTGEGFTYCNNNGFRLEYIITFPDQRIEPRWASFIRPWLVNQE